MAPTLMGLRVLLPFAVFAEKSDVLRLVAETSEGSFGVLPRRLDCVAALTPGLLVYETVSEGEVYVAVDQGVLIKTGRDVVVSARRALGGADLERLRASIEEEFLAVDEHEQRARAIMAKLETRFLRRFAVLRHE